MAVATGSLMFTAGLRAMVGVLLPLIERNLGYDRAALSAVASLALLTYAVTQPVVGWVVAHYGARRVLLFGLLLSVISGIGMIWSKSLIELHVFLGILPILSFSTAGLIPGAVLASEWFAGHQGKATGVFVAALPAGQALFGALTALLLPVLSWRETYVALTLASAGLIIPLAYYFLHDRPGTIRTRLPAQTSIYQIVRTPAFWLLAVGYAVCGVTDQIMLVHLVAYLTDHAYSPAGASGVFSVLSLAGAVGAVLTGPFVDRFAARYVVAGVYALRLSSYPFLFLFGATGSEVHIIIFAVLFGLTFMGNMPASSVYLKTAHGAHGLSVSLGWLSMSHHLGGAAGVLAAGILHKLRGSYEVVFVGSMVLLVLAVLASLVLPKPRGVATAPP